MNEPVTKIMKEFIESEMEKITNEHHTIISGWKSVAMTDENVSHLHNLFKSCDKHQIRVFEENNFLGAQFRKPWSLATVQLKQIPETIMTEVEENVEVKLETAQKQQQQAVEKNKNKKKQKKQNSDEFNKSHTEPSKNEENVETKSENPVTSPESVKKSENPVESQRMSPEQASCYDITNNDLESLEADLEESKSKLNKLDEVLDKTVSKEEYQKNDEHVFAKPQIIAKKKSKKTPVENRNSPANILSTLQDRYISAESNNLKNDLQKLASDISVQEKSIKQNLESGKSTGVDNVVLADFILRANTVLKETEAVTVRKIAEAETRKFLSSANVTSEPYLESISNELMHDIWPKTNRWRTCARLETEIIACDPKTKKKLEDGIEKAVHAAIKSAGEPLNKKQIGQIRKAAIVYRDFDTIEQEELEHRSNQILKMAEYVSAYETTNRMDELTRLRLAIAFCTKRRDYFLKARPKNFMQFSYMYIYLLEKINSNSASICACLNQKASMKTEFDELEEIMLNLFHEDYFIEQKEP